MEIFIKDNLKKDIFMDKELTFGQQKSIQDNGKTFRWMGRVFSNGMMEEDIADNINKD